MTKVSLKDMLEAGVHFGHKKDRWNPKMRSFIFTERNGVHIFDLVKTKEGLEAAIKFVGGVAADGGTILFVGTKNQVQGIVKASAEMAGMPYLVERWPGGMLTNFNTILVRLRYLKDAESAIAEASSDKEKTRMTKKEALNLKRELEKLNMVFGGVKDMRRLPDAVFVADLVKERNAVREAKRLNIPVIGIADSNANPDVEYVIPGNDDAVRSVKYITDKIAEAVNEHKSSTAPKEEATATEPVEDGEPVETKEKIEAVELTESAKNPELAEEEAKADKTLAAEDTETEPEGKAVDEAAENLEELEISDSANTSTDKEAVAIKDETEERLDKIEMEAEEAVVVKKSRRADETSTEVKK